MFQKLLRIFRVLKNTRLTFVRLKKHSIVLVHRDGIETLTNFVNPTEVSVIDPFELNIWVLFRCLLTRKINLIGYTSTFIKISKPKLVITFIDNDPNFYLLKRLSPTTRYIAVQNGLRHNYSYEYKHGFLDLLVKLGAKEKLSADLICTFGTASSKMFESYIQSPCLVTGNLKNNLAKIESNEQKSFDIVFMSQLAPFDFSESEQRIYLNESSISIQEFYEVEARVAKFLAEYCSKHSLKFAVIGKRDAISAYEKTFFSYALGTNQFTFLPRTDAYSSYENASKSRLVIVIDSTIGYELLSRSNRVGFFSIRNIVSKNDSENNRDTCFGYPNAYPDSGPFWTNSQNFEDYERIIKYLLTISDAEWSKEIEQYTEALMAYRPTNGEFIHMLEKEGIPVRSEVLHRA